jgi:hypothetical protein
MPYKDRDKQREFQRLAARSRTERVRKLKDVPCADCGGRFPPECMDFDHTENNKSFNIAPNRNVSWDRVLTEIAKCDIICANCHRIRTTRRNVRGVPSQKVETPVCETGIVGSLPTDHPNRL